MTLKRIALLVVVLAMVTTLPVHGQAPRRGGILNAMQSEDPAAGFSIHETATLWPYVKNLVPHAPVYDFGRMQDVWLDR